MVLKEYIIEMRVKAKVRADCPMRAADKMTNYLTGMGRSRPPYDVIDWSIIGSIYPELRKESES